MSEQPPDEQGKKCRHGGGDDNFTIAPRGRAMAEPEPPQQTDQTKATREIETLHAHGHAVKQGGPEGKVVEKLENGEIERIHRRQYLLQSNDSSSIYCFNCASDVKNVPRLLSRARPAIMHS
ncbi:hypothetical protein [Dyella nitratireducens]|uniref:hypothetical protein n=1 Tax=Dyella nitratireducens TaxID=1849580 RepID=UPI001E4AA6A5|nr:hypothetical protein [Dyella nitratireducens]